MSYWVEYSFQKGIRENLMTDDIKAARRTILTVCKKAYKMDYRASAKIFRSSKARSPIADIYFAGGYVGRWMWRPEVKGVKKFPYYAMSDGNIVKMKMDW